MNEPTPDKAVCPHAQAVSDRIKRRANTGLNKYGVTCARTDLTRIQWLRHAQDEAMDLCVYLERLINDEEVQALDALEQRLKVKRERVEQLDQVNKVLEERIENLVKSSISWDQLIVETGGNVNDGMVANFQRIVELCKKTDQPAAA